MSTNSKETTDVVTFTEEILNRKLNFLCSKNFIKLCIHSKYWEIRSTITAKNMREYGFSMTRILPYKNRIVDPVSFNPLVPDVH